MSPAVTFAVLLPALLVAHNVADHWLQSHHQARHKGLTKREAAELGLARWAGPLACAAHVTTYTATTAATVGLLWWALGLAITPAGFLLGQLVSAVTHYWADRRFTLQRLVGSGVFRRIGKGEFYRLGAPRPGRDDNLTLGTGSYALDQSWHWAWLLLAALLTALV